MVDHPALETCIGGRSPSLRHQPFVSLWHSFDIPRNFDLFVEPILSLLTPCHPYTGDCLDNSTMCTPSFGGQ